MDFEADLSAFFNEFADIATLPDASIANGIFDKGAGMELGMLGQELRFTGPSDSLSSITYGDQIAIHSINYTVRQIEPDGTGVTTLVLEDG